MNRLFVCAARLGGSAALLTLAAAALAQEPPSQLTATIIRDTLSRGDVAAAVAVYEQSLAKNNREDAALLRDIAVTAARQLTSSDDPVLQVASCTALVRDDRGCAERIRKALTDYNAPASVRVDAVTALLAIDDRYARNAASQLAAEAASQRDQVAAVASLAHLPPEIATPALARILESGTAEAQYMAAAALAESNVPAARAALQRSVGSLHGPAKIAAVAGLAGSGDAENLALLKQGLPYLRGADLFVAGVALLRQKEPKGREALQEVLTGDDEMLRLRAAGFLARTGDGERGQAALRDALNSVNPLTRANALREWRDAGLPPNARVRGLLSDADPWVRLRASEVVLRASNGPPRPNR